MYVKIVDNQVYAFPYSMRTLRDENTNISFPALLSADSLALFGVFPVVYQSKPSCDPKTHKIVTAEKPVLIDGNWTIESSIVELTDAEIAENTAAESDAVRDQRNILLAATDWMALSDNTMTTEWASYRQALRDITSQSGFPYSVDWPAAPGE